MSQHVVMKILTPGIGSEISDLISELIAADVSSPESCLSFIVHTGLKFHKSRS